MKRRRPLELSFDYIDTPERRVLSLAADGVSCVPVLGFDAYRRQWRAAPIHVHDECLEISFCLRGDLAFELGGVRYPFRPGFVFVSRPDEPHRLGAYPKGMSKYWLLFRIPAAGECILGLSAKETAWLVQELTHLPQRLFVGTKEIRALFKRLFMLYDNLPRRSVERVVRIFSNDFNINESEFVLFIKLLELNKKEGGIGLKLLFIGFNSINGLKLLGGFILFMPLKGSLLLLLELFDSIFY